MLTTVITIQSVITLYCLYFACRLRVTRYTHFRFHNFQKTRVHIYMHIRKPKQPTYKPP